ncbi:MAG: hypothetical protein IT373_16745, partial [Polyangiaceae bacterium]|nr:hypothetical protein [Polyangiaceae bacterium]
MQHRIPSLVVLGFVALLSACNGTGPKTPPDTGGPVAARGSGAAGREKVAITVYNQDFGLVREVRAI